jgi:hypothetical protein
VTYNSGGRRLRRAVALSFPVAFALHDLEELLSAGRWGRTAPARIRRRFPRAPERLVEMAAVTTPRMAVAVGVAGVGVAITTGSALRDLDGELAPLPAALAAYTAHGVTHLAQSAVLRSYTPGVATVPLVIAPYSVWAWRALRRAGVPIHGVRLRRHLAVGSALALGLVLIGQAAGWLVAAATQSFRRQLPQDDPRR